MIGGRVLKTDFVCVTKMVRNSVMEMLTVSVVVVGRQEVEGGGRDLLEEDDEGGLVWLVDVVEDGLDSVFDEELKDELDDILDVVLEYGGGLDVVGGGTDELDEDDLDFECVT